MAMSYWDGLSKQPFIFLLAQGLQSTCSLCVHTSCFEESQRCCPALVISGPQTAAQLQPALSMCCQEHWGDEIREQHKVITIIAKKQPKMPSSGASGVLPCTVWHRKPVASLSFLQKPYSSCLAKVIFLQMWNKENLSVLESHLECKLQEDRGFDFLL